MARYRFPQDRSALIYGQDWSPILTPPRTALVIYADQGLTQLADLQDLDGGTVANSTVYVNQGMIDEFLGPDGTTRLWAARTGSTAYPLDAQALSVIEAGGGGGGSSFVYNQAIPQSIWTVAHGLGQYPAAISIFNEDLSQQYDEFSWRHVDKFNLIISMDEPTAGVAVIK